MTLFEGQQMNKENSKPAPTRRTKAEVEAELKAINEELYPADLQIIVDSIKRVAMEHRKKPSEILTDIADELRTKKLVPKDAVVTKAPPKDGDGGAGAQTGA